MQETEAKGKVSLFFTTQNKMQNKVRTDLVSLLSLVAFQLRGACPLTPPLQAW